MLEPIQYTNVLDAFQDGAAFEFATHVGYRLRSESARIEREEPTVSGRPASDFVHVADSSRSVKELVFGLDLGLYRDLMLSVRVPFVLSDTRKLEWTAAAATAGGAGLDALGMVLPVSEDFESKARFGFPGLELGMAWGVTNQHRSPHLPTWVLLAEAQLATGAVQRPCQTGTDCEAGITSGTSRLRLESRLSYRYRHAEPYMGLAYVHPYVAAPGESLYAKSDTRPDAGAPPRELGVTTGVGIVPWEDRRRFQRITLDLRATATYVGAGRGISPLFDVLGTAPMLSEHITGLTDVEAHARLGMQAAIALRAARYVRFRVALQIDQSTPYLITGAPYCKGEIVVDSGGGSGTCGGQPFLPLLDLPGQRFRAASTLSVGVFATAQGQF